MPIQKSMGIIDSKKGLSVWIAPIKVLIPLVKEA